MNSKELSNYIYPDFFSTFFMFPFSIDSCVKLKDFIEALENKNWEMETYKIRYGIDYNEYVYFYPYIWDILFTKQKSESKEEASKGVTFFKYKNLTGQSYFIVNSLTVKEDHEKKQFKIESQKEVKLPLKNIFLHLFEVGVGILIFEIVHDARSEKSSTAYTLEDYLRFLETGRRIFVPFVNGGNTINENSTISSLELKKPEDTKLNKNGIVPALDAVHNGIMAQKVEIQLYNQTIPSDFFNNPFFKKNEKKYKPALSNIITQLLDAGEFTYHNDTYKPIIDDRMFVHAYFSVDKYYHSEKEAANGRKTALPTANYYFIKTLKKAFANGLENQEINEALKLWYQMIFLDWQGPSCHNPRLMKKLLEESTYVRWSDYGGFTGFSRFSSVMISDINQAGYIYNHFQSMYYQIAILLLFYRGAILNFSDRSEKLSNCIHELHHGGAHNCKEQKALKKILQEADRLNKEFLLFRNKFWFREVTAQDQGIEIFDLWSKRMRNPELMRDVESEINTLFEFIDSLNEKNISKKINILTIIGGLFLPIALLTSFFGMNFMFMTPGVDEANASWMIKQLHHFLYNFNLNLTTAQLELSLFGGLLIVLFLIELVIYKLLKKKY